MMESRRGQNKGFISSRPVDSDWMRRDDSGVAGLVAGLLMLAAIVAFLAYFNSTWVPTYVANKESSHATDVQEALHAFADETEDRIAREVIGRSFSRAIPVGVTGIAILGTGASSGELAVENAPNMTVTVGTLAANNVLGSPTEILTARGGVSVTTHTTRFPNQTLRYAVGAIQVEQSEGAFVDLRNLVRAQNATGNKLNLTIQAVNFTGGPQAVGGSSQLQLAGTVSSATTQANTAGDVRLTVSGVHAGAWRAALNRTLAANGVVGTTSADCIAAATVRYCFIDQTNTPLTMDVLFRNAEAGWTTSYGIVAAQVRS